MAISHLNNTDIANSIYERMFMQYLLFFFGNAEESEDKEADDKPCHSSWDVEEILCHVTACHESCERGNLR